MPQIYHACRTGATKIVNYFAGAVSTLLAKVRTQSQIAENIFHQNERKLLTMTGKQFRLAAK